MDEPRISALVVAKNEEAQLPGCLDSLRWVDEVVVVVDASSSDATEEIAQSRGHRVIVRSFDGFAAQRNAGLSLATGDWVLAIDADERVTEELAKEIRERVSRASAGVEGFRIPIRSTLFGRSFRYSGTQLDLPLRLFRKGVGRWRGRVHETLSAHGEIERLQSHITHTTHETMNEFLNKLNIYTDLEARQLYDSGVAPRRFDLTLRPFWAFARLYLARRGFLDGAEGFLFCALSAVSVCVRGWKLRELSRCASDTQADSSAAVLREYGLLEAGGRL
jgi:glycosyltransferase involved in cell wall biosynthesis